MKVVSDDKECFETYHVLLSRSLYRLSLQQAITVGATSVDDWIWGLSNYGPCVDIFAPGQAIVSATNTDDDAYVVDTGTSLACPHVAGKYINNIHSDFKNSCKRDLSLL